MAILTMIFMVIGVVSAINALLLLIQFLAELDSAYKETK